MIKGFGYFALFVFLVLCSQMGGYTPGFAVWFISFLLVASGSIALAGIQFPEELDNGHFQQLLNAHRAPIKQLTQEIEELAIVIRRDGLLAAEGLRKEMKDPLLKYLIKKVMDGFERPHLVQVVQNQAKRQEELFSMLQSYFDRVLQMIPVVGLIGSLFMMMDYFRAPSSALVLSIVFAPFLVALFFQLLLQSFYQKQITDALDRGRLYFTIVEEGIIGIQEGLNADLLRDKIQFRLLRNPKWVDV